MATQVEIQDDGSVDKDPVHLKKNQGSIHWKQKHGKNFNVDFADSPFPDKHFDQGKPDSGTATGAVGTYPYTVTVAGAAAADPDVIIDA